MKKLVIIFLLFANIAIAQDNTSWPCFRGNQSLNGYSNVQLPKSLKLLWSFKTEDAIKSSPIIQNGNIYIGSNDGCIYSISEKGTLNWKYKSATSIESPPLYLDNIVFASSLEGSVYAIDAKSGKLKWEYKTEGQISGSANWFLSPDKKSKRIMVGSYDFFLHCIDVSTGKSIWKYETENYINGSPSTNGEFATFGGCDGNLYIVDVKTGKLADKIEIGTYMAASSAIDGGKAYFGNYDGGFYCADLTTKKIVWKYNGKSPSV